MKLYEWSPNPTGLVPLYEEMPELSFSLPSEDTARRPFANHEEISPETEWPNTLILDLSTTMKNIRSLGHPVCGYVASPTTPIQRYFAEFHKEK